MRIRNHSLLCLAFWITMAMAVGCSSRGNRPVAVAPPPPPQPPTPPAVTHNIPLRPLAFPSYIGTPPEPRFDPAEDLVLKAEAAFERGETNYWAGHLEMAKREFNGAITAILQASPSLRADRRVQKTFDTLVERIHAREIEALEQGDGFAEPIYQPAPVDELQTLTFPEDPQVSRLVEEGSAGTNPEFPLVTNAQVESSIKYFTTGRGRITLETALRRSGRYRDMILRILREEGVPEDLIYLAQVESGFQPRARSYAAAVGMWQFLAWRGKEYELDRSWWEDERMDPEKATRAAARHLRDLYNQFGDWYLAMAGYHCGPVCVQKAVERTGYADFWELSRRRVFGPQTRNYVPVIIALTIIGKNPEKYGIADLELEPSWAYDTVTVTHPIDLRLVSETVDTTVEAIKELNPDLLRMTTPKVPEYTLRIPLGTRDLFAKRVALIPPEKRVYWRWHTVAYGETLSGIAQKYRTSVKAITEVNNVNPEEPLREAAELVIPVGPARAGGQPGPLAGPGERHLVERNETLSSIARRYNATTAQLIEWNNLDGTLIRVGQSLLVGPLVGPDDTSTTGGSVASRSDGGDPGRSTAARTATQVHRVRKGESLWQIAANYRTSVEALRRSNSHLGETLRVGDRLTIPAIR